jgi:Putative Actinobacterial Holin-X, holin superfamily III
MMRTGQRLEQKPGSDTRPVTMQSAKRDEEEPGNEPGGPSVSKSDRKNPDRNDGVPRTLTTIPLTDPHALSVEPSIGALVKDATAQMSTLVRAEVELARAEITRDVKKGLTGSVFFISALVVLFYSTFFFFYFLAELLDTWLWRWVAFLIVFGIMVVVTVALALFGYLKVRRIRGPQQTIESVKETRSAFTPGQDRSSATALNPAQGGAPADPSGW